jgi:hypothetical protein
MPRRPEIIVTVSPEAETEVTVNGVKGAGCKALTEALEKELGAVVSDQPTSEMHEREVRIHVQHRNRA